MNMTSLKTAKRELTKWRNKYRKEYKNRMSTWHFSVVCAANQCTRWRRIVEDLEKNEKTL
jgi:hypothetical protein